VPTRSTSSRRRAPVASTASPASGRSRGQPAWRACGFRSTSPYSDGQPDLDPVAVDPAHQEPLPLEPFAANDRPAVAAPRAQRFPKETSSSRHRSPPRGLEPCLHQLHSAPTASGPVKRQIPPSSAGCRREGTGDELAQEGTFPSQRTARLRDAAAVHRPAQGSLRGALDAAASSPTSSSVRRGLSFHSAVTGSGAASPVRKVTRTKALCTAPAGGPGWPSVVEQMGVVERSTRRRSGPLHEGRGDRRRRSGAVVDSTVSPW